MAEAAETDDRARPGTPGPAARAAAAPPAGSRPGPWTDRRSDDDPTRLPGRIAALMAGTIAALLLAVGVAAFWAAHVLDARADRDTRRMVAGAAAGLLDATRLMTLDYAKWDEAADHAEDADAAWLFANIGSTGMLGETAQLAVLWGGPLGPGLGWIEDGGEAPRPDLLDAAIRSEAERRLRAVPPGAHEGVAFPAWRGGELWLLGVARVERALHRAAPARAEAAAARLAMGRRLSGPLLETLGARVLVEGLAATPDPPAGRPSIPLGLPAADGTGPPAAWLSWDPPQPGATLLGLLMPPLAGLAGAVAAVAALGLAGTRRAALALVAAERRAQASARLDPLTGLMNRAAFSDALDAPARAGERAVLFLDLNGFKRVNDSIGHAAGDRVIAAAASRLAPLCGEGTRLARIGGDEFVFLLTGPGAAFRAEWMAHAAERALAPPLDLMGHRLRIGAAVGWAAQEEEGTDGALLVHRADLAMAEAKRRRWSGGGPVAWDALIEEADRDARAIEGALRQALDAPGQIWMAYQPIAEMASGRLARAEALARWTSPELGSVPPDRFVAVAERTGLVIELGRRILDIVCDDLAAHPGLAVALNVSPRQLVAPTFVPELTEAAARRGIHPSRIEIELTEQVLVDDPHLAARCLRDLHEAGFSTSLDDFGTGYSSIGYLRQMPFDAMKVDRSFVSGLSGEPERQALLDAMIRIAHALGLRVVCEGIETEEEMDLLRAMGCDLAQGWLVDRPMAIEALVARWLDGARAVA